MLIQAYLVYAVFIECSFLSSIIVLHIGEVTLKF